MAHLISSQDYRNEEVILEKIENNDFEVQVSPVFEIDGEEYQVVLDGHHSYEAAIRVGVEPELVIQNPMDNDFVSILENGDIDGFLVAIMVDRNDYVFLSTQELVW